MEMKFNAASWWVTRMFSACLFFLGYTDMYSYDTQRKYNSLMSILQMSASYPEKKVSFILLSLEAALLAYQLIFLN